MILAIFVVCICLLIWDIWVDFDGMLGVPAGLIALIALVGALILTVDCSMARNIDEKIGMYQQENTVIEEQIQSAVTSYMSFEEKTFTDVVKSPIVLATMFPELKSDTLVAKQIEVYIANNDKIKELKLEKIDYNVKRWWLYFG
jgi:hypothetical protein